MGKKQAVNYFKEVGMLEFVHLRYIMRIIILMHIPCALLFSACLFFVFFWEGVIFVMLLKDSYMRLLNIKL